MMPGGDILPEKDRALIKAIGKRVALRRRELKLTQEQLAERANLSQQYIASLECGIRGLGAESIIKLSRALQVSADYLLFGIENSEEFRRFDDMIRPLSAKELLALEEVIQAFLKVCGNSERDD